MSELGKRVNLIQCCAVLCKILRKMSTPAPDGNNSIQYLRIIVFTMILFWWIVVSTAMISDSSGRSEAFCDMCPYNEFLTVCINSKTISWDHCRNHLL